MKHVFDITNKEDIIVPAQKLISMISKHASKATFITLEGDLGAGKTTFVKCIAQELGVTEDITSPTFVIQKEYPLSNSMFTTLIHIDAYRLEEQDSLRHIKWEQTIANPSHIIFLEWPSMVSQVCDKVDFHISITMDSTNTTRALSIEAR
jgi:tRNA threonylcarbamoyladenosine biosynthesis protein TsaE